MRKLALSLVVLLCLTSYLVLFGEAARSAKIGRSLSVADLLEVLGWVLATYVVSLATRQYFRRRGDGESSPKIPAIVVHLVLTIVYVLVALAIIGRLFQQEIGTLLVTSGAISLFIGFVLRDTILDFFTGISINLDESVETGALVRVYLRSGAEFTGRVDNISWRATMLTTVQNESVIVPNRELGYATIVRLTQPAASVEASETLRFGHAENVDTVLETLGNALEQLWLSKRIGRDPDFFARLCGIDRDGISVAVIFQYDPSAYSSSAISHHVLRCIHNHLAHAGTWPIQPALLGLSRGGTRGAPSGNDPMLGLIESIDMFSSMSAEDARALARAAVRRVFERGETIVGEGDPGGSMFIVTGGVVRIFRTIDAKRVDLVALGPGDYFGEISLLTGRPRIASVQAGSRCAVIELAKDAIAPALRGDERLAAALSERVAQRMIEHESRISTARLDERHENGPSGLLQRISDYFELRRTRP